jgi:hypothetical protein
VDVRDIGGTKRRHSSNGYRWSKATPFFERLWRGHDDSVETHHALEHDPEKWKPVFRKDHAQTKS